MSQELQALFDAIRRECPRGRWSQGVELARGNAVVGESDDGEEIVLRISERGGLICPTVTLYPADEDWDCDCAEPEAGCAHAAAAVIALRRARADGEVLPRPKTAGGRIGYRFRRSAGGLALDRVVISGSENATLKSTLAAIASGRADGPQFLATQRDLAVERILGGRIRGQLPRGIVPRLLEALAGCQDVELDGEPVETSAVPVGLAGRLVDCEDGFELTVGRDPRITEAIGVDVVLCGRSLHPVAPSNLTGRELEEFGRGRVFGREDVGHLVTEVLPSLADRIRLEVKTRKLPQTVDVPVRLSVEVRRERLGLSVLPALVYGDPPIARVDAGRLVTLGDAIPVRDRAAERQLLRKIQNDLHLLPGRRFRLADDEIAEFAERLRSWDGAVAGRGLAELRVAPELTPTVRVDGNRLDVRFSTGAPDGTAAGRADPARVLRAWHDGSGLVALDGGGWAPLPADWLERFGDRVADLLAARDAAGDIPRCALPDLARLCEDLDEPVPPDYEALRALVDGVEDLPPAALPEDFSGSLRSYQRRGVDWLSGLKHCGLGALLADDMGLGKTVQALCAVDGRTLVVAPTSVLHNWAAEAQRFRPGLSFDVYHGPGRALDPDADLTITSYAILRLDADALAEVAWNTVILDEAQAIKNPDSQVARAAYRLRADFRITLSGTPVENRLEELWSQFHFLNRGLLGPRGDFEARYEKPIADRDPDAALRLRARIRPFLLRRLKQEVAPELPPRTDIVLRATLSRSERDAYDAVRATTVREVVERLSAGGGVMDALEALLRLRQAACHTALLPGQSADSSSKIDLLLEWVDEAIAEGHKMLVFSQWTSLLDLVEPHLERAGFGFTRIDGSTRDRGAVVSSFQSDDGPPILLASLKAGGVGLNLTAADHVFILDPWWNPFAEDQAADRAHRIGQDRPVSVYRLVTEDTVEERILALQERKRAVAAAALAQGDGGDGLTRDELLALLE